MNMGRMLCGGTCCRLCLQREYTSFFGAGALGDDAQSSTHPVEHVFLFCPLREYRRFSPGPQDPGALAELDRWILSELNQLVVDTTNAMDSYAFTQAIRRIEKFIDLLSNWYVRRSRRRFWKSESDADKLAAHETLYRCLTTTIKLLAPIAPFLVEDIYRNLVLSVEPDAPESIHLTDYPVACVDEIDEALNSHMELVMNLGQPRASGAVQGLD